MAKSSYKGITVDITFQGNTSKFNESVSQIDKSLETIDSELRQVNKDLKLDPTNATLAGQKFDLLAQKIKETKDKLALMKAAQDEVKAAYSRGEIDGGAYRDFQRELGKTEAQLKSLNAEARQTAENLAGGLKAAVGELSNVMSGAVDIIKKGELALAAFSAASAKVGASFESAMSQVAATLQVTAGTEEYEKLSAAAKQMGETTSYSAAQAASALNSLAQAGYSADESIERLPKTLALAKAGGLDLGSAAKIVTQSMASLQLSESDLDKLLDEMARTAQKSNTNIAELGEAIKGVGGTMNMAGQSVETMLTELGMLANAGVAASEAGTHLRNVMLALVKTDVQKSLHDMGVEVTDSTGAIRDLSEIMTELAEATDSMTSGDKLTLFGDLFNVRDLASVNALLNGTKGSMQALRAEIENSQGAASQMAETMGDNLTGDVTILKSAVEGLQIAVSERLSPSLRQATQDGTKLIGGLTDSVKFGELRKVFDDFGESLSELLRNGLTTAAQVLPTIISFLAKIMEYADDILAVYTAMTVQTTSKRVITAVANTVSAVKSLTSALRSAEAAQTALNAAQSANIIGLIATVIGLAAGALVKYKLSMDEAAAAEKNFTDETQKVISSADDLTDALERNAEARQKAVDDVEIQYGAYEKLAKATFALAEQENLSAAQKKLLKDHVDELNAAIPDLNLAIDEETGKLNKQYEAVEGLISKTKEYYLLKASEENLTKIGSDLFSAEYEHAKLQERLDEVRKKKADAQVRKKYFADQEYGTVLRGYVQADAEIEKLTKEEQALQEQSLELSRTITDLGQQYDSLTKYTEKLSGKVGDYSDEQSKAADTTDDAGTSAKKAAKTTEELKAAYDSAKSAVGAYKSELKDLLGVLENVNKGTAYSTSQMLDLIEKYPELINYIHQAADGYTIEANAVQRLTEVKAENTLRSLQMQISALEGQMSSAAHSGDRKQFEELRQQYALLQEQKSAYGEILADIQNGIIYSSRSSSGSSGGSSYSSGSNEDDPYSEMLKERKAQAKSEQAELENLYKTEKISAEDYYNGLMDIARRYYDGIGDLREEYLDAEEKVYTGLKKAQEDELSNAKKLEDQLKAVKDAEDALRNAQNQQVQVYSGAAGFRVEQNTAAIEKAQQSLADKNYSLAETLLKNARFDGRSLTERLQSIGLAQIRDMLPDLSGITLPSIGGGTTTQTTTSTRSVTYNGGDINITIQGSVDETTMPTLKTSIEDAVRKGIEAFLDEENAHSQTGGI